MTDPTPPVPSPILDPRAVERVLARAAELQSAGSRAPGEGLSEAELVEIAREVGLSPEHVRRAVAEERVRGALVPAALAAGRDPQDGGLAVRLAGPGTASASRVLRGRPGDVHDALARWLEREECMALVRRLPDGSVWEPRRDLVGNVLRGLRAGGGTPSLRTVHLLGAAVTAVDETRVVVRLEADVSAGRRQRLAVGGVTAASGALAGGTVLAMGAVAHAMLAVVVPLAVLPMVAGGAAAWALARGHRQTVARAQLALERLLDRLEHAAPPAGRRGGGLLDLIDGVRRTLG